jgi:hypothetical protein
MTKEQYLSVKTELKDLGKKIRETKKWFKDSQRAFTKIRPSLDAFYNRKITEADWEKIRPEYKKLEGAEYGLRNELFSIQREYRHLHIVYSMARGKAMSQIEPKVRKGNEPSKYEIQRLMKLYDVQEVLELQAS